MTRPNGSDLADRHVVLTDDGGREIYAGFVIKKAPAL
jgi:hypothetical protein